MTFDRRLANELLERRDRDTAPYFAGREDEIQRFDAALRESELGGKQAVFRIYQGAPGCGKTSLVHRLRQIRSDGVLFVSIVKDHLASGDALVERVRHAAVEAGPVAGRIAAAVLRAISSRFGVQPVGEALGDAMTDRTVEKTKLVLHLDEAQMIDEGSQPGLVRLHAYGLGAPTVCLFTGLSHTANRIGTAGGVSRLADNAVVNMGAMAEEECAESTSMMLDELGAVGDEAEKVQAARTAATLSYGWPQHLHCAQTALCRELIRADGVVREVNPELVARGSDRKRFEYYLGRLSSPILGLRPEFTAGVIERIAQSPPAGLEGLDALCQGEMQRQGWGDTRRSAAITSEMFADALVEKGVVSVAPNRGWDVAIPSMAEWAASRTPVAGRQRQRQR